MKLIIICLIFISECAWTKEIALSFDDAPLGSDQLFTGKERTNQLIKAIKILQIPQVIFFSNSSRAVDEGSDRLMKYANSGHLIANHTHSHYDIDKVSYIDFVNDFETADKLLSPYPNFIKLFRFPFLHEGKNIELKTKFAAHLKKRGYKPGYVTVDSYDWYMNEILQESLRSGKKLNRENFCKTYSTVLLNGITFYDTLAVRVLGRSPRHILLLHENDAATLCLNYLVELIRSHHWQITTPLLAYKDELAKIEPASLFNKQGKIAAIAESKGIPENELVSEWENKEKLDELFHNSNSFE